MVRYECKCCGCDFSEEEGIIIRDKLSFWLSEIDPEIECPMCGALYDEEEKYVEKYND